MNRTLLFFIFLLLTLQRLAAEGLSQQDVFVSGTDGYHTYRIPALVVATNGMVLAFCEGRKLGTGDSGRIDLLMKRSTDGGNA